jgi:hypothetical protein
MVIAGDTGDEVRSSIARLGVYNTAAAHHLGIIDNRHQLSGLGNYC